MKTIYEHSQVHLPAVFLDRLIGRSLLSYIRYTSFFFTILAVIISVGLPLSPYAAWSDTFLGISFIALSVWGLSLMLYCYHNAHFFFGLNSIIGLVPEVRTGVTYELAEIISLNAEDLAAAFATHRLGRQVLLRAGISPAQISTFLSQDRPAISAHMIPVAEDTLFSSINLGQFLLQQDIGLQSLLKEAGVQNDSFQGALRWVFGVHLGSKRAARWWSKDNLSQIKGIGREWSYGRAYKLERYLRNIRTTAVFSSIAGSSSYASEKIDAIESILARDKAANALIIGEPGVGKMDLMVAVASRMESGRSLDAISGKHVLVLDTDRLFASHKDKQSFEVAFLTMLDEAVRAGNLILVLENISTFITEAASLQVQVADLLDPYLANPALHVVATDTPGAYHNQLETLGAFTRRFSEVLLEPSDLSSSVSLLQNLALAQEQKHRTLFTYTAIEAIATSADRYLVEGVMPDKAVTLLVEVAARAGKDGQEIVTSEYVYDYVGEKTGIPAGPIREEERDLLLNIEEKLHERVIGQGAAIDAIAKTMRRARAGIGRADKPIGTFLFLGPTGVGKTETAKALAFTFFGAETAMHRLDMSEFSGPDALERLIGTQESSGALADMLREHPYSVVLLDEFEKAGRSVHDLFLQILDEGMFTDGRGTQVNARNTIIIATSNAGSQLILQTIQQRKELATLQQEIVDHIIKEGIYRPELINRFDSTIIFEPLTLEEQSSVAGLLLHDLYKRIEERGFRLEITRELMDVLVEKGYDPQFGARPMQRVVQDLLEEKIAQKIISGEVQKGETIMLSRADFSEAELAV
ncbi:MAG: ATP-dependent Clp protease ATP-binding subunit [Patescibacteria group bacterium]